MAWNGKRLNLSQQKHAFTKRNVLQHEINTKKIKARFSCLLYDIRPENGAGLFSKKKISKREDKKKVKKRISPEAYDINKQAIYMYAASKSKI